MLRNTQRPRVKQNKKKMMDKHRKQLVYPVIYGTRDGCCYDGITLGSRICSPISSSPLNVKRDETLCGTIHGEARRARQR